MDQESENKGKSSPFFHAIQSLVTCVEALRSSSTPLTIAASLLERWAAFQRSRFVRRHGEKVDGAGDAFTVKPELFRKMRRLDEDHHNAQVMKSILPKSFLVSLVSQFDAFMGRLLTAMFTTRPELLKASERALSFSELTDAGSFDAARNFLMEKEVESVLRKSHADQFSWIEQKLSIPLRKELPAWQPFIEVTERRNLFVHCDGVVSHQYISVCKEHGVSLPTDLKVGDRLDVGPQYYKSACECLCEVGVKLGQVVWRKLLPESLENADDALISITYELLVKEHYSLAIVLLIFGTEILKKHATERHSLTFLVNLAQAYKWSENQAKCDELLQKVDWSAKGDEFRLCVSVLRDDHDASIELMRRCGSNGPLKAADYRDWPIFRRARQRSDFKAAFVEIFGNPLVVEEEVRPTETYELRVTADEMREFVAELSSDNEPKEEAGMPKEAPEIEDKSADPVQNEAENDLLVAVTVPK